MRIEHQENSLLYKMHRKDEDERLKRKLEEIMHRKPLLSRSTNIPTLPIIQSARVARMTKRKQLDEENKKIKLRLQEVTQRKSEYSFRNSDNLRSSLIRSPRNQETL